MLDIPLLGIRREKQDGSGLRSNLNRRSNFEDFWVGHPEKSLLKMSDSLEYVGAMFPSFTNPKKLI
jgi:hypothetical protein